MPDLGGKVRMRTALTAAVCFSVAFGTGCLDRTTPVAPEAIQANRAVADDTRLDRAGFIPFTSLGTACTSQTVSTVVEDGILLVTFHNQTVEDSKEVLFAGPATTTPTAAIDLATGQLVDVTGSAQYSPTAANGTWEATIVDAHIRNGRLHSLSLTGFGTGDLDGLGITLRVNLDAKASTSPPHLQCAAEGGGFLSHGEIFRLP